MGSTGIVVGGSTTVGFATLGGQATVAIGDTLTFSNLVNETKLVIDIESGVVGTVTSFYGCLLYTSPSPRDS